MEFTQFSKDDYIKNHLKDYTFIVKQGDNLQAIWHTDLNYENAEKVFELFKEKENRTCTLIAILEGDYISVSQNGTRVIIPSKYYYNKKHKRTKEEKLLYFKQICKYLNIEY